MPLELLMQGREQQPFLGVNSNRKRLLRDPHDAKRGTLSGATPDLQEGELLVVSCVRRSF
jgi:hypothetical protein